MKDIKYDQQRPLRRLEAGDSAIIEVKHSGLERKTHKQKYGAIPDGTYKAKVVSPYELECEEYPVLSGKYCYWYGNKHGCAGPIYADELSH